MDTAISSTSIGVITAFILSELIGISRSPTNSIVGTVLVVLKSVLKELSVETTQTNLSGTPISTVGTVSV